MSSAIARTAIGQSAAPAAKKTLPSVGRQKSFIMEHAAVLNRETRLAILSIVMMEIVKADPDPGSAAAPSEAPAADAEQARLRKTVVTETGPAKEIDLNLDSIAALNVDVLGHIYNIVSSRLELLSQPARAGGTPQGGQKHS